MHFDDIFANHLLFMATHRGAVRLEGLDIFIDGPIPALTSFVPGSARSGLPDTCPAVRLAPWSGGVAWESRLESNGFRKAEALAYMELADSNQPVARADTIDIETVADEAGADAFAAIQDAGFATGKADVDSWWGSYFRDQARRNYTHPAQRFYLGRVDGQRVTSTLVVRTPGVSGIYAVATKPAFRRRGAGAAVLERVRLEATATGFPRIVLQATSGSYAAGYYEKLGFLTRYVSQVWRR